MLRCCCAQEEISKLLRFESSKLNPGEKTNLDEYVGRMKAGTRNIYYLSAPRSAPIRAQI